MNKLPWYIEHIFCRIPIVKNAKNEDGICIEFANILQKMTRQGNADFVWFHVANEFAGKVRPVFGSKLKAMGKVAGVSDYIIMSESKCLALEFKTKTGKQSKGQKAFEDWCASCGVPYEIVRNKEEGFRALVKHDFIDKQEVLLAGVQI